MIKNKFLICLLYLLISTNLLSNELEDILKSADSKSGIEKAKVLSEIITKNIYLIDYDLLSNRILEVKNFVDNSNDEVLKYQINSMLLPIYYKQKNSKEYENTLTSYNKQSKNANTEQILQTYIYIGTFYNQIRNVDSSMSYMQKAYKDIDKTSNLVIKLQILYNLGFLYSYKGEYNKSFELINKCIDLSKGKNPKWEFKSYSVMSTLLSSMEKFEQSYSFCLKAQDIYDKELKNKLNPNNKNELLNILFIVNNTTFISLNNLDRPDESLKYLKKALECANEIDDQVSIAKVLTNTANYYEHKGNIDSSMYYAKLGLEHCLKYDLKQGIAINYSNLAIFNIKKRNFSEAVKYGEICLDYIEKEKFEYLKISVLMSLVNSYDTLGNHKKALTYLWELVDLRDSAYDKETNDKIAELNIQYNIEKRAEEEKDLLEKQKNSNYVFILLIIIVAVIAIGLYIRYNEKSKSHKLLESKNEEIKLQNDQLFDLNATKDKFFSIIAHDLKGPLGNFNNVIDLLISQFNSLDENERLDFLKLIKESSQNIYNLLINLLDWSKAQRNLIKLELTQFPIDYYVKNTLNLLSPIAKTKSIELKKIINDDLIINGDVNLLTTVLRNLVSNALKYTPNGGSVTVSSEIKDKEILISVRDTGVGMSKKILDGLFKVESTSSMPGTNDETGTGLGLILCKEFVEFHNGKIWVESAVGKGSTFFYTIPK